MKDSVPTIDAAEVQRSVNKALEPFLGDPLTDLNLERIRLVAEEVLKDYGLEKVLEVVVVRDAEDPYKLQVHFVGRITGEEDERRSKKKPGRLKKRYNEAIRKRIDRKPGR